MRVSSQRPVVSDVDFSAEHSGAFIRSRSPVWSHVKFGLELDSCLYSKTFTLMLNLQNLTLNAKTQLFKMYELMFARVS